jgi:alkane 1-monooxygenase
MLIGLLALALLALFATMPLVGLALGVPWMTLVVTFALIPALDAWVGAPRRNAMQALPESVARWIPRAHLLLQGWLLIEAVRLAPTLAWGELAVFALAVGTVTGGIGITVAHELGHRPARLDRAIAKALLVSVLYGHFFVEHVRGHHVRVATPDDPATAPRGMSVYRFILRSVIGGLAHACKLEAMRLRRSGRPAWHPSNWVLSGTALSAGLLGAAAWAGGAQALVLFALQAIWAVVLLEIVNYIEHYGLQRRRRGTRYEPVQPHHSWNADFAISNWLLFNLQLHSDHHANMQRPYEALRTMPEAPQLPAGYPTMVVAALVPPLRFALIEPRLATARALAR